MSETIGMLQRARGIIERGMQGGASMMQLKTANNLAQTVSVMVQARLISSADGGKLAALLQSSQKAEDEEGELVHLQRQCTRVRTVASSTSSKVGRTKPMVSCRSCASRRGLTETTSGCRGSF